MAGLGQRVITLSVASPCCTVSHKSHSILTHRDQEYQLRDMIIVTKWSPPGSWCLLSLISLLLMMLLVWLVTCHYLPPIPVTAQLWSSAQLGSPDTQHCACLLLSLGQNDLTISKVLAVHLLMCITITISIPMLNLSLRSSPLKWSRLLSGYCQLTQTKRLFQYPA